MSMALSLINRVNQLEKKVKELEKEIHDRPCRQKYEPEPEKESPPFKSWVK